jgi:hypothetical protein
MWYVNKAHKSHCNCAHSFHHALLLLRLLLKPKLNKNTTFLVPFVLEYIYIYIYSIVIQFNIKKDNTIQSRDS